MNFPKDSPFFLESGKLNVEFISFKRKNIYVAQNNSKHDEKELALNRELFDGKNFGNGRITRMKIEELVGNVIQRQSFDHSKLISFFFDHPNVEKVLGFDVDIDFYYFVTPLFVTKLSTVWVERSQFVVYDVKKMFLDFLNGLIFLHSKNFSHGTIHEHNLAFNGTSWYISGLLTSNEGMECSSGLFKTSFKSRRCLCNNQKRLNGTYIYIPTDDLWQLILAYVITYYGFNPFDPKKNISNHPSNINEIVPNIKKGTCHPIASNNSSPTIFGKLLYDMLLNKDDNNIYTNFNEIIINNTDEHVSLKPVPAQQL